MGGGGRETETEREREKQKGDGDMIRRGKDFRFGHRSGEEMHPYGNQREIHVQ